MRSSLSFLRTRFARILPSRRINRNTGPERRLERGHHDTRLHAAGQIARLRLGPMFPSNREKQGKPRFSVAIVNISAEKTMDSNSLREVSLIGGTGKEFTPIRELNPRLA
jgi:hypothetical protein